MIEKTAYFLGRNDEEPNIALALELYETNNMDGVREIVQGLSDKTERLANDCIKVLYEIGERKPELIADYVMELLQLLKSRNNRLVWGGMTAIAQIASLRPKEIYDNRRIVIDAYEKGSIITRDYSISVFAGLAKADQQYEKEMLAILMQHLRTCRLKEVGQHAERAAVCANQDNAAEFIEVLRCRKPYLTEAQNKRVDKLIKQLEACVKV
jgi:fructose-1,6-bisphosphatase